MKGLRLILILAAGMLCADFSAAQPASSRSDVRPAPLFCSNMVLQQRSLVPLWGEGTPGEPVTVTSGWNGLSIKTVVDSAARWCVELITPGAGGPYRITISGRYDVVLENVMIGEVWLCSGQSNMEWAPYSNEKNGIPDLERELAAANDYPALRFFNVRRAEAAEPQEWCSGSWRVSDSDAAKWFTAVGQFFGRELNKALDMPVGLIGSYWGGTGAEVWTPASVVESDAEFARAAKLQHNDPRWHWPVEPGYAYNAMIHPLTRFPIAGVIWYQGESNAKSWWTYARLLERMVAGWRAEWGSDFLFYIVQISPFYDKEGMAGCNVLLREQQQAAARAIPGSGLVTISDVGDAESIHPLNKRPVGERLAWLALSDHYRRTEYDSLRCPLWEGYEVRGSTVRLSFSHTGGALKTTHAGDPAYFEIAGADGVFHPAEARIVGDGVEVCSPEVVEPREVRYAWKSLCFPDLLNASGLPVGAFRTKH